MIIVLKPKISDKEIQPLIEDIKQKKLQPVLLKGTERITISVIGDDRIMDRDHVKAYPFVEKVIEVLTPYKLVSRESKQEDTVIDVKGVKIGGKDIVVMAGPCSVENEDQVTEAAKHMKQAGVKIMRGGAFKPRTSPYSFQGLGHDGVTLLKDAAHSNGMLFVTEVMDTRDVKQVADHADLLQVGARNMQNFDLLREVGKHDTPVLLKRGMSATIDEFLLAAEYIMKEGNHNVILCERGLRTFETAYRNVLDINAVSYLKSKTHLPIICDPSHATGKRFMVSSLAKASIAAGADGLIIEVHPNPEVALCDGPQSLTIPLFETLMKELKPVATAVGRDL